MTTTQIEGAIRTFTALGTEDAKACGCDRASVKLQCDTTQGDLKWCAHIYGWKGSPIIVSTNDEEGRTPGEALTKAHRAFLKAVDAYLAEQAEEVTE